ncbi:MAG TPA: roadblock/LC7 domain-containing protein [Gaiellaceae bacterium]|nr:roadblock/LC7 domain-containing protein [Gaiellaceae bacterium]
MEAGQALADLVEISQQIESAVLADRDGAVLASTLADEERSQDVARDALELLREAAGPAGEPAQLEAALPDGSVFVVADGERVVAAVTGRQPTVGLVLYDLKTCLRLAGEVPEEPAKQAASGARTRKKKKDDGGEAGDGEG